MNLQELSKEIEAARKKGDVSAMRKLGMCLKMIQNQYKMSVLQLQIQGRMSRKA
jgi:uncharacterized membrane protein (DUF106 family)